MLKYGCIGFRLTVGNACCDECPAEHDLPDSAVERLDHEAIAQHLWRIREAAHMVFAGIDWEHPTGVTEPVPINRLADLKAALDRWDRDMGRTTMRVWVEPDWHPDGFGRADEPT